MKQRIYIDTSVIGGYFDAEFAEDTISFFERVRRGEYTVLLSDILEQEVGNCTCSCKGAIANCASGIH